MKYFETFILASKSTQNSSKRWVYISIYAMTFIKEKVQLWEKRVGSAMSWAGDELAGDELGWR